MNVDQTSLDKFTSLAEKVEVVIATKTGKTTVQEIVKDLLSNNTEGLDESSVSSMVPFYLKHRKGTVIKRGRNGGVTFS